MNTPYDPKITPWQIREHDFPRHGAAAKLSFLIRYALLAPSSHSTQPWKFSLGPNRVQVFVDKTRWLRVADQDQRELHVSVGCALENLLIAAEHFGYGHQTVYFPKHENDDLIAEVTLTPQDQPSPYRDKDLFDALTYRHTNRQTYEEQPIPQADLRCLEECCVEEDIQLHTTSDIETKRRVDELIVHADALQFADPAWREELGHWIGQGAFGTSWLMSKMGRLAVTYLNMGKSTARKDSELLMSSPVLAVLCSKKNDRASQVKVGQVLERIWLRATDLGIQLQPMNQILQIPDFKEEVTRLIPLPGFPQLTFRLGYAEPDKEHTPRRPLEEVLI